jgi:choline dehydrogenase
VVAEAQGVGRNLQDHARVMIGRFVNVPTYNSEMDPLNGLRHLANYLLFRRGPLASAAMQAMAWARTDASPDEPDIHMGWFPYGADYNNNPPTMHKRPCISVGVSVSRPHTRGSVELYSSAPQNLPVIRHRLLSDERDLATMLGSIDVVERIFAAPALASAVIGESPPIQSGGSVIERKDIVRAHAGLGLHAVGTCRMGSDSHAVVDTELRVRGVSGVRVVDASVMPRLVSANTLAAAIMIGEKGSHHIDVALRH